MKAIFKFEDVFNVTGRGSVITGRVIEGDFRKGDIAIIGDKYLKIVGLEMFSKAFDGVIAGDNVGILFGNKITSNELKLFRGTEIVITDISHIREDKLTKLGL